MKWIIVLAVCIAVVNCVPVDPKDVEVLRYDNDNIGIDGYKFAWVKFEFSSNDQQILIGKMFQIDTNKVMVFQDRKKLYWRMLVQNRRVLKFVELSHGLLRTVKCTHWTLLPMKMVTVPREHTFHICKFEVLPFPPI